MADSKRTHRITSKTSLREVADFPEVKDKILNSVEVSSDLDHFEITISFQDNTALALILEPCVAVFPILSKWENGEETPLKEYETVHSKIPEA